MITSTPINAYSSDLDNGRQRSPVRFTLRLAGCGGAKFRHTATFAAEMRTLTSFKCMLAALIFPVLVEGNELGGHARTCLVAVLILRCLVAAMKRFVCVTIYLAALLNNSSKKSNSELLASHFPLYPGLGPWNVDVSP
jgi:hypothetical protein